MAGAHFKSNVFLGFNDQLMDTGRTSTDDIRVLTESEKRALKKNGLGYRKLHLNFCIRFHLVTEIPREHHSSQNVEVASTASASSRREIQQQKA